MGEPNGRTECRNSRYEHRHITNSPDFNAHAHAAPYRVAGHHPRPLPTTTDRWYSLMLITPYPWSTTLPSDAITPVDGVYAKLDPDEPQWWNCMRCADWLHAGGVWRLQLEKGIY